MTDRRSGRISLAARAKTVSQTLLIFNPAARGDGARGQKNLLYLYAAARKDILLAPTRNPGEARQMAAEAVRDGCGRIVAAGGDGTINEVVNGIGTSGVPLGIVPMGTVNVFARELGIPLRVEAALELLDRSRERIIDLGLAEANGTRRYFVQLAGVGLDAASVKETHWELKKRVGPLSYVWAAWKVLHRQNPDVEVTPASGAVCSLRGPAVLIGNGRLYGGPFPLFPRARLDDGLLDLCLFRQLGSIRLACRIPAFLQGRHVDCPEVEYVQASAFTCTAGESVPFEVDGELGGDTPVKFSVLPRALRVLAPPP